MTHARVSRAQRLGHWHMEEMSRENKPIGLNDDFEFTMGGPIGRHDELSK